MSAASEPEKYSIDEMMDRLKGSSSENPEDGELVTRQDGTQAIRVRKRKRRSKQPQKEQQTRTRRARIVQVSGAMLLICGAVATVGAAIIYANSSPFRKGLEEKIMASTGASLELSGYRMNPQTANALNLVLQWPEGNILEKVQVRGLVSEVFPSSFLGKEMTGEETTAIEGTLNLRIPGPGDAAKVNRDIPAKLPVHFNRYRVQSLNVILGEPRSPLARLEKSEATLTPVSAGGRTELRLYQGQVIIPEWPKLRMDRSFIEFRGAETDIVALRMMHETDTRGFIEMNGTVSPYTTDQPSTLSVRLDSFQMSGLTGPYFEKLISGRIDTRSTTKSNFLTFFPAEDPAANLDISFQCSPSSEITVQGFPFLVALSRALDDDWFERPEFDLEATGAIRRKGGVMTLANINFTNKSRLSVRGDISVSTGEKLSGTLEIGLPETMVAASRVARFEDLFGPPRDGFRWMNLKLGGTTSSPTDNFMEQFNASGSTPPVRSSSGSSFEDLTRPR